jgi:hypothetical protein
MSVASSQLPACSWLVSSSAYPYAVKMETYVPPKRPHRCYRPMCSKQNKVRSCSAWNLFVFRFTPLLWALFELICVAAGGAASLNCLCIESRWDWMSSNCFWAAVNLYSLSTEMSTNPLSATSTQLGDSERRTPRTYKQTRNELIVRRNAGTLQQKFHKAITV